MLAVSNNSIFFSFFFIPYIKKKLWANGDQLHRSISSWCSGFWKHWILCFLYMRYMYVLLQGQPPAQWTCWKRWSSQEWTLLAWTSPTVRTRFGLLFRPWFWFSPYHLRDATEFSSTYTATETALLCLGSKVVDSHGVIHVIVIDVKVMVASILECRYYK